MMTDYEIISKICNALWDSEDKDCKAAEEYGFKDQVILLFTDCYDYGSFCKWLAKHECNPWHLFSEADIRSRSDYETDDEFEEAKYDGLMANDDYIVISWQHIKISFHLRKVCKFAGFSFICILYYAKLNTKVGGKLALSNINLDGLSPEEQAAVMKILEEYSQSGSSQTMADLQRTD